MIYLFDFDGTLVDSMPFWTGTHVGFLKRYGIEVPEGFVDTITPLGNEKASRHTISLGVPLSYEEYIQELNEIFRVAYGERIQTKAHVKETLERLKAEGHRVNVLTASPHEFVDPCLKRNEIYDLFEEIWSIDDFGHTKSETIIYEMAAQRLGVSVKDCVFVDDNFTAVSTAKEAGMKTIAIFDEAAAAYEEKMRETADQYVKDFAEIGRSVVVEGHRGFCALYPENTLLSFSKAIELGVDAVEFDVWLSKDKVPVLMHDGNSLRTCGVNRDLRDMTLEEIKALDPCYEEKFGDTFKGQVEVPTLKELLDLVMEVKPELKLGVEIKEYTEENVDLTVALLKEYGVFEQCWFYAFNGRIIRYLKEKYNARTMGYPDYYMMEFDGYDAYEEIGISMRVARSEVFDIYPQKGMPMHLYCADTEEDVRFCLEKGADLITANDPRALLKVLGRK